MIPIAWLVTVILAWITKSDDLAPVVNILGMLSLIFPLLVIIRQIGRFFLWMFGPSKPTPFVRPNRK